MTAALWAWTLANAALASAAILFAPWLRARPLLAGALVAVVAVVEIALLANADLGRFGEIHLFYLHVVVALPLVGLAVLVSARRVRGRRRLLLQLLAGCALLLAPVGAYATFVEPFRLVTERATVPVAAQRAGSEPVRVAVLADFQTNEVGDHEREAIERLVDLDADVILIPGDIFQGRAFEDELPELRRLFSQLEAPGGVYFAQGDADRDDEAERIFAGTNVQILHNDISRTRVRDRELAIAGVELRYTSAAAVATVRRLERLPERGEIRILLAHRPDVAYETQPGSRVDLTVSGHTHGGQVQLPLLGPLWIASNIPRNVGAGGLHTLSGERRLYVSRGVGVERGHAPRMRFRARPEISLLSLEG